MQQLNLTSIGHKEYKPSSTYTLLDFTFLQYVYTTEV